MRSCRSYGSVRGAVSDDRPYRDLESSSSRIPSSSLCRAPIIASDSITPVYPG